MPHGKHSSLSRVRQRTDWPEALRAISRIGYDYYNNGFCNLWQGWEDIDDYGEEWFTRWTRFTRTWWTTCVTTFQGDLHKALTSFIHDAQGYGNWSNQAGVIDRIIDHIIEGIMEDGLLEKELVS